VSETNLKTVLLRVPVTVISIRLFTRAAFFKVSLLILEHSTRTVQKFNMTPLWMLLKMLLPLAAIFRQKQHK